jgi:hypothetical protein
MKSWGGIKGKLDKLVGNFFRSRTCDYALTNPEHICKGRLEWVHIKTRKYLLLRWDFFNNLTLCSERHFYFHNNPDEFIHWLDKHFEGRTEYLNKKLAEIRPMKKHELETLYENKKEELG